ncbi:MAG TPA: alkaline phosphatase family protein [Flavisolibacter sp.]|nr:alkaline phosphatase family protein [Flavisolibacter sp.]
MSVSVSNTQKADAPLNPENKLFIITLDGFRWEEVFHGADSLLIGDAAINTDTAMVRALYWSNSPAERRKKLMPFFWNIIAQQGELYGNRDHGNLVNVSNPYALSYPGYSELLTGSVDYSIYGNEKKRNPNRNILELLNSFPGYKGKVAAFTSWDAFPYILDKQDRSKGFVLNSGLQQAGSERLTSAQKLLNAIQCEAKDTEAETRYDELTYVACREHIQKNKPSVVFLSFSGTDDAGHENRYDEYLQEANNADRMIGELWRLIQAMPEYAGKTTFLITTDHGRGKKRSNWSDHGLLIPGSSQTWYALLGNTIVPHGEMKVKTQIYQKDLYRLMMDILSRK